ncbi:hypothetical protein OIE68_07815 [Nocardia vinacea]|uniref:hypothetical protein n=1 Tax=Nocardia vinacea TaxID=96468 RepID=UPI002E15957A|nr:hypothetical protein OIE68_07815 [Nocardia vinacea]
MTSAKVLAASRTLCDLVPTPSPRSSAMLPDLSNTSATAAVLRGTALAVTGINQLWLVCGQVTVTLSVTLCEGLGAA